MGLFDGSSRVAKGKSYEGARKRGGGVRVKTYGCTIEVSRMGGKLSWKKISSEDGGIFSEGKIGELCV